MRKNVILDVEREVMGFRLKNEQKFENAQKLEKMAKMSKR